MPKDYKKNCRCPHHPFGCFGHPTTCQCAKETMEKCPYCGGEESKCDFSFLDEVCSQMPATQDNRACKVVLANGRVVWDEAAVSIRERGED